MHENVQVQVINTDHLTAPVASNSLYVSRRDIYEIVAEGMPEVTVCVQAYNRLEKTKRCVESILKYTQGIHYELLLLDHGSNDGTLEYFKSVSHPCKKIVRVTKNLGPQYATGRSMQLFSGRYCALVTNDAIVTKNWLSNLLRCLKSDPQIGMVVPGSSNVSNLQEIPLSFSSYEEMQKEAAAYNQSDYRKWEQRLRVVPIACVIKRVVIDLIGIYDVGFFHDFPEDDFSLRVRRAGFKLMVCTDTFIHHDHDFRHGEDKEQSVFQLSLEQGRKNFNEKYKGLDSWADMNNYEAYLMHSFPQKKPPRAPRILGVDVACGLSILQIKNELRRRGIVNVTASAFTPDAKYLYDLQTVCDDTACDRIERLHDFLENRQYDYIVLGKPVNTYAEVPRLLRTLLASLNSGGTLFLKLRNCLDIVCYLTMMGQTFPLEGFVSVITLEQFNQMLQLLKVNSCNIINIPHQMDDNSQKILRSALESGGLANNIDTAFQNLMTKEYAYCITK